MIKIFALPSHTTKERTSGVDFVRIIQPMNYLAKERGFKIDLFNDIERKTDWVEVAEENDIIFLNYTTNAWAFAAMGCFARKNKKKIVLDVDDALWLTRPDNIAYSSFKPGSEGIKTFTAICNEVDYITTTSSYLKNVICHYTNKRHEQVEILPNAIDLENLYTYRFPPQERQTINILHFGSTSHFQDLEDNNFVNGMDKLMKELPSVNFITVGSFISKFKYKWGQRYRNDFGDVDLYRWVREKFPKFMEEADIVVAPLEVDIYNRAKSYIKYLEYSSAQKPGVYQDIFPYQQIVKDGENGFLASRAEDWYECLKKLVLDIELRKRIAKEAFKTIQDYTIQKRVKDYAKFFKKITH